MDPEKNQLSRISTLWTLVARARGGPDNAEALAQAALLDRYHQAVHRHLIRGLRSPAAADELLQEFALRFLRGDFHRAAPDRGRFRDYVRAALNNLIREYRGRQAAQAVPALEAPEEVPDAEAADLDAEFVANWRQVLIDRAWDGLAALELPGGVPFHTALRLKVEQPDATSEQLADELTRRQRPAQAYTDAGVRKVVQRARDLFTDLLLDEIARSLRCADLDALEQEVIDLGLQAHCKRGLDRRRGRA